MELDSQSAQPRRRPTIDRSQASSSEYQFSYFYRNNVGLQGLAKFSKESSEEEREHVDKLTEYHTKRGGKVRLRNVLIPRTEYDHEEKGDALYAMEVALNLEKLINERLLNLHSVAARNNGAQLADFVDSEFLDEQVATIQKISEYVTQLRRVDKGHGTISFLSMAL